MTIKKFLRGLITHLIVDMLALMNITSCVGIVWYSAQRSG